MKNIISKVFEFGGIQNLKNNLLHIALFIICINFSNQIYTQTIPSTGSSATTCGDCTPTGWIDFNGTPDISNRTITGGQGTLGAEATWFAAPLPLPPTGDMTWITMKDLGGSPGTTEESVQTTMGGIVSGKVYRLTLYTMGAISNEDGGDLNDEYYGGTYKTKFDYRVGTNPRQVVSGITQNVWGKTFFYFIGDPDGSGNMTLGVFPGEYSGFTGANRVAIEPFHLAVELNALEELDTDGDGVPDTVDIDDDNDGILDTDELTVSGTTYDPLGDEDGDLLPNYLDVRDDNGTSDGSTTDYSDINGDGIPDIFDFDKDGIPNHLDLDADNDGIPDIIEGQPTATYITPTGFVGANGLDSAFESDDTAGATSYTITNTDSGADAIPDYLDLDSDNDGTSDEIEANSFLTDEVGNNGLDNAYDNGDTYADTNGNFDNTQTDNFPDTTVGGDVNWRDNATTVGKDTDGDGILDNVDIDDDNDGIPDVNECATSSTSASDASGIQAETSITNSANAIGSGDTYAILDDVDDSLTIDLNSDTDVSDNTIIFIESSVTTDITHTMRVEQSADNVTFSNQKIFTWTATGTDENKEYKLDGVARYVRIRLEVDNGGTLQIDNVSFEGFIVTCDADGDGIPNELDLDSDNDGIPDNIEAQTTTGYENPSGVDTDNDGLDDAYDPDCIPCGGVTGVDLSSPNNHDTIDTPDYLDTDSDNDGTSDRIEANLSLSGNYGANGLDANYDNGDNYADVNGNFDTTPYNDFPDNPSGGEIDWRDATSTFSDNDNDGIADIDDFDDDNDGILDVDEGGACNGTPVSGFEAYYTYEDTTNDVSGNNNNLVATEGTAPGSIYSTTAKTGNKSLAFDGNFFLRYNDGTFMNKAITFLSYSLWFNPSSLSGTQHLIDEGGATNGIAVRLNGNTIEAAVRENNVQVNVDTSSLPTLTTGTWYHVVITYNNGDVILYLDGTATPTLATGFAELAAHADGSGIGGRFNDSGFGNDDTGDYFTGFIDEVLYYQDTFLSPAQVAQLDITCTSGAIIPPDTDGDGIPDYFDLDSDNDGIPDNIEAQTTSGYVMQNGVYDANGVDTAYTNGLTAVDTDSDGTADYLELDSDNDGILDNTEAGLTLTGVYGNNGLDNAYDNGDNYTDVNGSFDGSQTDNFPDADSDVFNGGDVDYRDDTFTTDKDGDGVNDEVDLDDDNDGILDSVELGTCVGTNSTLNWGTEYSLTDDPVNTNSGELDINNVDITMTRTTTVGSDSDYEIGNDATVSNGTNAYIFTQRAAVSATSRHTFTFTVPVKNLGFTIYDIDEDNGSSRDKVEIIITQQDGSIYTLQPADYDLGVTSITNTGIGGTNVFENTLASGNDNEDITITSIPVYITQIQIVYSNTGSGSISLNQSLAIGNFTFCAPLDSDGDGVFDYLDLDADNDGIPDNIEAQTTSGYIKPTGNYSITGIDLAYNTGLTPINTDGDADADYLDLNSDGDADFDIVESGAGLTDANMDGVADGVPADFGTNGLIDTLETDDTDQGYTDVNGEYDETFTAVLTDTDGDVNSGGDLDYRDTVTGVDTDGDGIPNSVDIDDDNDGVLDTDEADCSLQGVNFVTNAVAYWSLDNNTNDVSGNGNNERPDGNVPPFSTDAIQGTHSANFNGSSHLIRYSQDSGFMEAAYTQISFSAWIKPDNLTGNRIVYEEGGGTNGSILWINNGVPTYSTRSGSSTQTDVTSSVTLTVDGEWHHVAVTFNAGVMTIYVDGISNATTAAFSSIPGHGSDGGLGGAHGGGTSAGISSGFFDGLIDAARYSNTTAWPSEEILIEATKCSNDKDGDGIINSLDIDSDNDGIPDNVEAQTTLGYVAPTGAVGANGLYDIYESDDSPSATSFAINNHDGVDSVDFLDTDSDNDGKPDLLEKGNAAIASGTDTDGDGLDDNFEGSNVNDPFDSNDEIENPSADLPDVDNDVATDDVDYRDDDDDAVSINTAGTILWLRADLGVTTSPSITWLDQSSENHDATEGTNAPTFISNAVNFNPAFQFNGTDDYLEIVNGSGNGIFETGTSYPNLAAYTVSLTTTVQNSYVFREVLLNDAYFYINIPWGDNLVYYNIWGDMSNISHTWTSNTTTFDIHNFYGSNDAGNSAIPFQQALYLNGKVIDTDATTNFSTNTISGDDTETFFIGSQDGLVNFYDGQIAEIIVFADNQSSEEQQSFQSYLAIKYGKTLDFTTDIYDDTNITEGDYILRDLNTKIWDYTANSTFHNDVAGIGRDDALSLNQKQSKSVNSDAIITIGLNTIAADNASNVNTFTTNKDFLVWGNNNGVINTTTETELICAPEKTIGRTWKIVETGNVGSVEITATKSTLDAALATPFTIKVLKVADDVNFTTNVNYVPLAESGAVYTANYNFDGTKYFTYSEINGIFWNGSEDLEADRWIGGNNSGKPTTNIADRDKVMIIDAQGTSNHPTLTEDAIVECVWIKANSKLMVADNKYLEFDENFILDGEVRLIDNGQLIQTHTGFSNVQGNGKLYRDQAAIVPSIYRYHYWSSPVRELNEDTFRVGQVMKDGSNPTSETSAIVDIDWVAGYDGANGTPIKIAPYWIYSFLNGTVQTDWKQTFQTGVLQRGQGYSMKSTGETPQNFTFVGTPNDGSITFDFTGNRTSLLGNPYPSALDAVAFISTNLSSINGTLYFWEHTGEDDFESSATEGHNLTGYQGGYSQRNIAMGIAASSVPAIAPFVADFENATDNGTNITQTIEGFTVTYSTSNSLHNLNESEDEAGGTSGNYLDLDNDDVTSYSSTISFNKEIDLVSVYIAKKDGADVNITFSTSSPGNDDVTQILTDSNGVTVTLDWKDLFNFTITADGDYNLIIDDIKFREGNLPSVGDPADYHAPNRYIAVAQGFFVSADNDGGEVRFENAMRSFETDVYVAADDGDNGTGTFFFKGNNAKKNNTTNKNNSIDLLPILKLGFNHTGANQLKLHRQIGISFKKSNSFDFDNGYDSEVYDIGETDFYWHFPDYSDKKLIIAGVQEITEKLEVPLTITIGNNAIFSIEIDAIKNINRDVYLNDKLTNKYYKLSNETPIELNLKTGTYTDRFYLTFNTKNETVLSTEDVFLNNELSIFINNKTKEITIQNLFKLEISKIQVFNILGQKIREWKEIDNSSIQKLKVNEIPSTFYIIKIKTEKGTISRKILIE